MNTSPDEWLVAAQLLRPQGRRGELLSEPHVPFDLFVPGRRLWLAASGNLHPAEREARVLEGAWQPLGKNSGRVVLKLAGVDDISAAETLNAKSLLLRTIDLPSLPEDTFRVRDLVGCALFDGDLQVGIVVDLQFPVAADGRTRLEDAPDLLAVFPSGTIVEGDPDAAEEAETVLVPFVRAWLTTVDLPGKRIVMQLPPGLFGPLDTE